MTNADGSANNAAYFWLTGGLSSFLDNAPTYLVFFELAGGRAEVLMREGALTLAAIILLALLTKDAAPVAGPGRTADTLLRAPRAA